MKEAEARLRSKKLDLLLHPASSTPVVNTPHNSLSLLHMLHLKSVPPRLSIHLLLLKFLCCMSITEGRGECGLPTIELSVGHHQSHVICYLHGATIASYTRNNTSFIFMSENAIYNGVKALRGGVPLVFPQFGQPNPAMPQHGFLRTSSAWKVSQSNVQNEDSVSVTLALASSESTRALWPYSFIAEFTIELTTESLKYSLSIFNTDSQQFECQALLHTYIRVPSIHEVKVHGLHGVPYIDKLSSSTEPISEINPAVTFSAEVDRIYLGSRAPSDLQVSLAEHEYLRTSKAAWLMHASGDKTSLPCDVVVWNPWIRKATELTDLGVDSFPKFVCIEPGPVAQPVKVNPAEKLVVQQSLTPMQ